MKSPDLAVAGVKLLDSDSAAEALGSGPELKTDDEELPHARFVSKDGAQELAVYAPYGAATDEYAEVEVSIAGKEAIALKSLSAPTFVSAHGIELGMTPAQVIERFGKCVKSHVRDGTAQLIQYEIANADSDDELKSFGYPIYYAEYEFEKGKLVRYRFGFEYP